MVPILLSSCCTRATRFTASSAEPVPSTLAGSIDQIYQDPHQPQTRLFLHYADLADACLFLLDHYEDPQIINVGTGEDLTIGELAQRIARIAGFSGRIAFDPSKPDGIPRKLLDVSKIHALSWRAKTPLEEGILRTYRWFRENFPDR
jgi:nucleoside-diphosphate-sugar epimerase